MTEQNANKVKLWCVERREGHELVRPGSAQRESVELGEGIELPAELAKYLVDRGDYSFREPTTCTRCGAIKGVETKRCVACGAETAITRAPPVARANAVPTTDPFVDDENGED